MESVAEILFGKEPVEEGAAPVKPIVGLRSSLREGARTQEQAPISLVRPRKGFQRKLESTEELRMERMRRIMGQYMPTTSSYTPLKGSSGIQKAMDFFGRKYGKHIAAGIVGNLIVESGGFDPNVIAGKRRGDQGKAFGVAQWHPDRQANFQKAFGRPIQGSSLDDQLRFIDWELNNTEKKARNRLLKARTPAEAAEIFDADYERSSGQHRQRRVQEADKIFRM
jgi:hypothetical protein